MGDSLFWTMSSLHTTLAQDSFRLYFGVIDQVIDALKKDLKKKGKDEDEATEIINQLQSKWKENLHKSHCIDNKNMMGFISDTAKEASPCDQNIHSHPDNNANTFNPNIPTPTSFTSFSTDDNEPMDDNHNNHNHNHNEPVRKKQKLNNMPPPLHHIQNNPHIQGLGVPQIDELHNPFTNPLTTTISQNDGGNDIGQKVYEGNVRFIVQSDGPSPMKPNHVGFDDEDDDDDEDDHDDVDSKQNEKKESDNKKW